jgi:release factor glutamine methyltransferase
MTVKELLVKGRSQLMAQAAGSLEAELLLCHVLGVSRAWLYANADVAPEPEQSTGYVTLLRRRKAGEPIAYLTGTREFWSLPLRVTPDVLIPRPETELLVETALAHIPRDARWRVADLGTGSGAVAIAIAVERPLCEVHATELSTAALEVARENSNSLASDRVQFHAGSWCTPLEGRFQLIVSNPPYVAASDHHMQRGDCRFEPVAALTPGHDALSSIRQIATEALEYLEPGGLLAFEHGFDQGSDSRKILEEKGYRSVATIKDLEGRNRVTSGLKS